MGRHHLGDLGVDGQVILISGLENVDWNHLCQGSSDSGLL
jgi:hypothetical protein